MKFVDLTDQWVYISTENGISRSPQIQGLQTKIGTRPWCDWNVLTIVPERPITDTIPDRMSLNPIPAGNPVILP